MILRTLLILGLAHLTPAVADEGIAYPTATIEASEASAAAAEKKAELPKSPEESLYREGREFLDHAESEKALLKFQQSREKNPEYMPAWFYEIRVLRQMKKDDSQVARELLKRHPEFRQMKMFKKKDKE